MLIRATASKSVRLHKPVYHIARSFDSTTAWIGAAMQFITLEDEHGTVEATVIPGAYRGLGNRLTKPGQFLAEGPLLEEDGDLQLAGSQLDPSICGIACSALEVPHAVTPHPGELFGVIVASDQGGLVPMTTQVARKRTAAERSASARSAVWTRAARRCSADDSNEKKKDRPRGEYANESDASGRGGISYAATAGLYDLGHGASH